MREINSAGLKIIEDSEKLMLKVYPDPVGLHTAGWGHLVLRKDNLNLGDTITKEQADNFLKEDVQQAEHFVETLVTVPLTDNQFSALVSFVFNIGAGDFAKSTMLRMLKQNNYQGAATQFERFIYSKGQRLNGLVTRREHEKELFLLPS